jgi:hypothetical protein
MMMYTFLNHNDILVAIKEDMLLQVGVVPSMIANTERAAVSYMKDFITNRYDLEDCFPFIYTWNNTRTYKPAEPVTSTFINHLKEEETITFTPIYRRELNAIINYAYDVASGKFYKAIQESTNQPVTNTQYWQENDPRDMLLVQYCTDIVVFNLHKRVNPRKIPQLRIELFNQAKEWLDMVNKQDITPDLPKKILQPETDSDTPKWGGGPNRKHYY